MKKWIKKHWLIATTLGLLLILWGRILQLIAVSPEHLRLDVTTYAGQLAGQLTGVIIIFALLIEGIRHLMYKTEVKRKMEVE